MRTAITSYCRRFCLFTLLLLTASCGKKVKFEKTTIINHYASGSAMAYINGKLYLQGDNMGYLIMLDTDFNAVDSITIIDSVQSPIPKQTKPDIEAATHLQDGTGTLLLISSGSLDPYRNNAWIVNTETKEKTKYDLAPFYGRLKAQGIPDLNIEGAAGMKDNVILSSRGNKSNLLNHLIFTSAGFWKEPATAPINIKTLITGSSSGSIFSGVSGMAYSEASDCLLLTVSTENTANSYDDGEIGKSYLWMVNNISRKTAAADIVPDRIIDLEAGDTRFHGQKIETACIISETQSEMTLALAADNDDGKTVLFRITIKK